MRNISDHIIEKRAATIETWRAEFKALIALGAPIAATQVIQFSVNTIDVLMIGRLGPEPLGAASLGLVVFYLTYLIGIGPAMAMTPLVSQTLGEDPENRRDARRSVRMGLWSIAILYPLVVIFYLSADKFMAALGQPTHLIGQAKPYILALAPGWPFMLGVLILRNFLAAIDRTRAPLLIIIGTTALNAFLNYLLIFGNWGFPQLGLVGAGIASSLAHFSGFAALVAYVCFEREARRFDLFTRLWQSDWARLKEITKLGWPISVTIGFEALLFNASYFIMGRIGVNELAAYHVALNAAAFAFMVPLGLSMAGATRVGLARGAGDEPGVRRAAITTIVVSVCAIMMFAIPIALSPQMVASLYLDTSDAANAAVIRFIAVFLPVAAGFMFFDAVQVAAAQCLRGLKDVNIPMVLTGVSYWLIGFPVAAWLGLYSPVGAVGVWYGLLLSLVVVSVLLGGRLWLLLKKA